MLSAVLTAWAGSKSGNLVVFLLGAIGSALVLTKINLGIFYFAALAQTCVVLLSRSGIRAACLGILLAGATVLTYALMHANLARVRGYYLKATLCVIATFGCGSFLKAESQLTWCGVAWAGIGSVMTAMTITIHDFIAGRVSQIDARRSCSNQSDTPCVSPLYLSKVAVGRTVLAVSCTSMLTCFAIRGRLDAYRNRIGTLQCITGLTAMILIVTSHLSWAIPFLFSL
jgi:hypothetical protein